MTTHQRRAYDAVGAMFATLTAGGVTDVVVSPGSRSTPLAVAAARTEGLSLHVVLDERSAAFTALGMSTAGGRPTALVCTSGSAAANYLPAVVEANRGRVPLVVITADRPEGYLDRDAPQTIDQIGLYGVQVRSSVALPVAHEAEPTDVEVLVRAALAETVSPDAGPIHINFPFAKPLEPDPEWRPHYRGTGPASAAPVVDPAEIDQLEDLLRASRRPVLVAGPRRSDAAELAAIQALGIPTVADPLSGHRTHPDSITTGELIYRSAGFDDLRRPDLIIRTGGTPTGRATQQWLSEAEAPMVILDPDLRWTATGPESVLRGNPTLLAEAVAAPNLDESWADAWQAAESTIDALRQEERSANPGSEVSVTAAVLDAAPGSVWTASSMPVRHVDVMAGRGRDRSFFGNRGANGIDGTIACAAGAALRSGERVTAIVGDLAFLHDVGSVKTVLDVGADLTVVVLDNGGGAIFSMLPIAGHDEVDFEGLFFTPHSTDLAAVAAAFGVEAAEIDPDEVADRVAHAAGITVLVVRFDPADTHAAYERMVMR